MINNCTWDERYKAGKDALPWDTGIPAPELVEYFDSLNSPPKRVVEIGCGTGTNAIWMAQQGSKVIAIDISSTAIDVAQAKGKASNVDVDFRVLDILEKSPVTKASVDFVFDRGVYHVMLPEQRQLFINRIAEVLDKNGYWLCLTGNADEVRDPETEGPPQLKASDLVDNIEEKFELHQLERASFILPNGKSHLAWKALFRKKNVLGMA